MNLGQQMIRKLHINITHHEMVKQKMIMARYNINKKQIISTFFTFFIYLFTDHFKKQPNS